MDEVRVGIAYSFKTILKSKFHPKFSNRYELVMELIKAYGMLENLTVIDPDVDENKYENYIAKLTSFHGIEYLQMLYRLSQTDDISELRIKEEELDEFGLLYDCESFKNMFDFCISSVASTMMVAKALIEDNIKIGINWHGGWHHAQKNEAAGFCYMNDIVYGITTLLHRFRSVLYIDLDLHLGDGVEEAFMHTSRVVTLSLHHAGPGFFPPVCADLERSTGFGRGRYSAVRFAFNQEGVDDVTYSSVFEKVLTVVWDAVQPAAVVLQCGADGLVADPHRVFCLTNVAYEAAVSRVLDRCALETDRAVPLLMLGGGGYHFPDCARLWARLTALALRKSLPDDIPDHDMMHEYGPYFYSETTTPSRRFRPDNNLIETELRKVENQMKLFSAANSIKTVV